ncbi:aminotransferase class V-fold PLP-dependent enzyme [Sandarakinorhabdus sp.]|uniref:cysteine desulfurase family protein n=1 Tax=Sandarakinorhabdus sp. TaxID=1916663 RepID=UPI00333E954D
MKSRIYLDHAATTPVSAAAIAAMTAALGQIGNPSSVHAGGRAAYAILETARNDVTRFAGALPEQIIFTSGGTEALALALHGARLPGSGARLRVLAGATEHDAVLQACEDIALLPVDRHGLIDLAALEQALLAGPALVAVQAGNNETGVVQPLAVIAAITHAAGGLLLADCVQAAGKIELPAAADFIALSAHKLGGPPGVGALVARAPETLHAVQRGGGQERGHRGGTHNLPGIAGFAAAAGEVHDWAGVAARRSAMEADLIAAGAVIHGNAAPRLPHISSIGMAGVPAATQVMMLDLDGFMVSAGAACSSGKVKSSHVLDAMGIGAGAGEAIRVSLSASTSDADIAAFIAAWLAMAARLGRS